MQAKNIDEVISHLEVIIQKTLTDGDPMGYFAALYHQVTVTVKEGIAGGYYTDSKRMEMLDVIFANRYLEAYTQFQQNKQCSDSWRYTFETAKEYWPIVLQNLLLGMNAHINLDLGIAAAQTCPGDGVHALKDDFDKINTVLAGLVADVEKSLTAIWPTLKILLLRIRKMDSFLIDFSMKQARDGAWKFATELAVLDPLQQEEAIKARDKKITEIALLVSKPGFWVSLLFLVIRIGEIGSVANKIESLRKKKLAAPIPSV
ncbi:MAG: hypothetical protein H7Z13_02985 [Ferruginibacter sp.]|nr:hypothetical protein [Ferruginibacter sp.]